MNILYIALGAAAIIAAFGIRDFGHSRLVLARTDRLAFEYSVETDDEAPKAPTVH